MTDYLVRIRFGGIFRGCKPTMTAEGSMRRPARLTPCSVAICRSCLSSRPGAAAFLDAATDRFLAGTACRRELSPLRSCRESLSNVNWVMVDLLWPAGNPKVADYHTYTVRHEPDM